MEQLLGSLTRAVEGAPAVAVLASLLWGVASVVLSPCHLASIPLIVGFVDGQGRISTRRAFAISALFAAGILVTIAGIGVATAMAGRILGDIGTIGTFVFAGILVVFGLVLLDVIPLPWSGPGQIAFRRRGPVAAFVVGLVFGIALGPCSFAFMAPVLAATLGAASRNTAYAVALLLAYGVGHSLMIVLAGTFTEIVQRYLNWNERSRGAVILRRVCGVLVILGAVYVTLVAR
jgi:cytochrome c-type biogenesis protein